MPVVSFPTQIQRFNMATQQDPSRAERQEYNNRYITGTYGKGSVFITVFFPNQANAHIAGSLRLFTWKGKKKGKDITVGQDITIHG